MKNNFPPEEEQTISEYMEEKRFEAQRQHRLWRLNGFAVITTIVFGLVHLFRFDVDVGLGVAALVVARVYANMKL